MHHHYHSFDVFISAYYFVYPPISNDVPLERPIPDIHYHVSHKQLIGWPLLPKSNFCPLPPNTLSVISCIQPPNNKHDDESRVDLPFQSSIIIAPDLLLFDRLNKSTVKSGMDILKTDLPRRLDLRSDLRHLGHCSRTRRVFQPMYNHHPWPARCTRLWFQGRGIGLSMLDLGYSSVVLA